jgi:hypothetical protein
MSAFRPSSDDDPHVKRPRRDVREKLVAQVIQLYEIQAYDAAPVHLGLNVHCWHFL